jgi:hypothetical protein
MDDVNTNYSMESGLWDIYGQVIKLVALFVYSAVSVQVTGFDISLYKGRKELRQSVP